MFMAGDKDQKIMLGLVANFLQIKKYCWHIPAMFNGKINPSRILEMARTNSTFAYEISYGPMLIGTSGMLNEDQVIRISKTYCANAGRRGIDKIYNTQTDLLACDD